MKKLLLLSFSLFISVAIFAQNNSNSSAGLPNDLISEQSIREMHDDSNRNINQWGNYPVIPAGTGSLIQRTAFAYQRFADQRFVTFPIPEDPDELTIIKDTIFSDFVSSGIFAPDGTFYMTDRGNDTGTGNSIQS